MKQRSCRLWLFVALPISLFGVGPAVADSILVTSCPAVLDVPGGHYVLGGNLSCAGFQTQPAITISANDVRLDLDVFTLSGPGFGDGILVAPGVSRANIEGGGVTGFGVGIELGFNSSEARVSEMAVAQNAIGIHLQNSNENRIEGSTITGNRIIGVSLTASQNNRLQGNLITGNFFGCDLLDSSDNEISDNNISGNGATGVHVVAPGPTITAIGNRIRGNTLSGNGKIGVSIESFASGTMIEDNMANRNKEGIVLMGTGNTVKDNTALGNSISDLTDRNPNCDANIWEDNTFGTANQACIH
jgi:parallel beta-helix repeat protein